LSKTKQPGLKELKAQAALAPAVQLAADATNEQLKRRIREKAIEALNKKEKLSREEWQIVQALWDRIESKSKPSEEERLTAAEANRIADVYDKLFSREFCPESGRGTKA
jgi:hypothetical protein